MMKFACVLFCVFVSYVPVQADHDLDIYFCNDVFVFDVFENRKRVIKFVPLFGDSLAVVAEFAVSTQWPLSSYGHHEQFLFVAFHNRVEVFDLSHVMAPKRVQMLMLNEWDWPRFVRPKIAKVDMRLFVMSRKGCAELIPPVSGQQWQVRLLKERPHVQKNQYMDVGFPPYSFERYDWPYVVQQTELFRYLIDWEASDWKRYEAGGGSRKHRKYLSAVRVEDGQVNARLLLGEVYETID